ncbi:THUMP domain-containing protein 2 isoform X1 [Monodelphis domestica]|uniref:THUMP domain-containing protein 2 isoform X1 n=2 Tax=Monodelphis domestica TaxID=13616 RepID=UPI0024E1AE7F|nr:THUMP domain-containing protein 2 isoform X1 [Monodelphis domestica]XP_056681841.1 THUMP domain-containing protein 2 isoform X1 [Monodelphis domestica]
MSAPAPEERSSSPKGSWPSPQDGARYFCTAGRGLEPFLMQEVRARLAATEVEYISGKVFFTTNVGLTMLKQLKSAERLFLLLKRQPPLIIPSGRKGKIFNEIQRLVTEDPMCWVHAISIWRSLLELEEKLPLEVSKPHKRTARENENIITKKLKIEQTLVILGDTECQLEKQKNDKPQEHENLKTEKENFQEESENDGEKGADHQGQFTFRVSCRCSGTIAKTFTTEEVGRVIGIALIKQFGWKADLRNPKLEIFIHLNDIYSVVGIPVFRLPLASRAYIKVAGLRSTIAWTMASLAEINVGAVVLDPMCGLGTILLEAAKEWPNAYYLGADVSDSQLSGACDNLKSAGLVDRIELLKFSVTELPLLSKSVDVIISDIPFGKKFKLGKDIKSILHEMERVLCVGGTIVLLLSEELHRNLQGGKESNVLWNSSKANTDEFKIPKFANDQENNGIQENVSSSSQDHRQECLDQEPIFGTLVQMESHKVSLGRTEAFILKYKKIHASGLQQPS